MTTRFHATLWLAALAIAGTVNQMAAAERVAVEVGCRIRATQNDAGTRLDAIISASGPVAGTYS